MVMSVEVKEYLDDRKSISGANVFSGNNIAHFATLSVLQIFLWCDLCIVLLYLYGYPPPICTSK